jgi:3-oxoacyl-[acyl-carrier-protein] synthase II
LAETANPARVWVTGIGAVTPFGWGLEAFRRGLFEGRTALRPLGLFRTERHRTRVAGEVPDGVGEALSGLRPKERARLSRSDGFALAAAREAAAMARIGEAPGAGVFLGSSTGGLLEGERVFHDLRERPGARLAASRLATHQPDGPAATIARAFAVTGPVVALSSACSAAGMAIEAALRSLREREVELAFAGGADALNELTYAGFNALRAVDEGPCRPFRAGRTGLSLGEGAGMLILESERHARARGAEPLAELLGAGSSCDATHMTAPDAHGEGLALAVEKALADAGIGAEEIDVIDAHGTGTPLNDLAEWRGLERVLGPRVAAIPMLATKGAVGHLLGACAGVEAAGVVLALATGSLPPTQRSGAVDPECPARLVLDGPLALAYPARVLSINLAFGGANVALVLRAEKRSPRFLA